MVAIHRVIRWHGILVNVSSWQAWHLWQEWSLLEAAACYLTPSPGRLCGCHTNRRLLAPLDRCVCRCSSRWVFMCLQHFGFKSLSSSILYFHLLSAECNCCWTDHSQLYVGLESCVFKIGMFLHVLSSVETVCSLCHLALPSSEIHVLFVVGLSAAYFCYRQHFPSLYDEFGELILLSTPTLKHRAYTFFACDWGYCQYSFF